MSAPANNVVRLPTAAKRMPQNNRYAAQREACKALRAEQPWPDVYKAPWLRERERTEYKLEATSRTPELLIAIAIFAALPDDIKRLALKKAASACATGCPVARDGFQMMLELVGGGRDPSGCEHDGREPD